MPPRVAARPARENDFSDVGKIGRRTGVTLPQGRLDVNGIEEITGIFSSPRKPSPLRNSTLVVESIEDRDNNVTPLPLKSTRKSLPPPRSASPRKSGISGTAKRGGTIDVLGQNKDNNVVPATQDATEILPIQTTSLLSAKARRFSPEITPRKGTTMTRPGSGRSSGRSQRSTVAKRRKDAEMDSVEEPVIVVEEVVAEAPANETITIDDDQILPAADDEEHDDQVSIAASQEEDNTDEDEPPLPPPFDDEEADQTFELETRSKTRSREPTVANSRKKRKSDALENDTEVEAVSSPAAKRAKRISDQSIKGKQKERTTKALVPESAKPKQRGRPALKDKDPNMKLSRKQNDQLNSIIEKVKARPDQKKSLYVLRRETPADDGVTHTRSGRISVKPLAYWRNEKCVFGGSPGGASLQDGARFPLNSIKEIIRTDEVAEKSSKKSKKLVRGRGKGKHDVNNQSEFMQEVKYEEDVEDSDQELDEHYVDPDAEPWEIEKGTFRGSVAVWDQQTQQAADEEDEEIDIAYAAASIETREVKGSTFRYAKLLSSKFFGSGIVDLPPGGVKKAKNSRRMHMSFFVATGRVTVQVNALGEAENRFSIGKGGWWQVPRGNQYAIENEHQKPARIFFSQACEPLPSDMNE